MPTLPTPPCAYADLGAVWLHDQLARLTQRHAQFGAHFRIETDRLLARAALTARTAQALSGAATKASSGGLFLQVTIDAIARGARQEASASVAAAAALTH